MKPYVGILLCVNGLNYFVPVSSPKPKHNSMSNGLDFIKLVDAKSNKLLGVLNLNNMIPVPEAYFTSLAYDKIDHYRTFRSVNEQAQYISLLQAELDIIKGYSDRIQTSAQKLYDVYVKFPESPTSRRCCNFPLLEKASSNFLTGKPLPSKAVQPTSIQERLQLAEKSFRATGQMRVCLYVCSLNTQGDSIYFSPVRICSKGGIDIAAQNIFLRVPILPKSAALRRGSANFLSIFRLSGELSRFAREASSRKTTSGHQ